MGSCVGYFQAIPPRKTLQFYSAKPASDGNDTFTFNLLTDSLLASHDDIISYATSDRINAPSFVAGATLRAPVGNATSLSAAAISAVLNSGVFTANSAQAFTATGASGTFIALNNGIAGFNSATDSIIHLEGFNIGLTNPVVII